MNQNSLSCNYLAFDPGGVTGWALCKEGTPMQMGEEPMGESMEGIFDFLSQDRWDEIGLYVVEDYIIRPASFAGGYAHQWNKGETLQIIGAIKFQARQKGAAVILQQPSIKPIAAGASGLPYTPGKAGTHMFDACLHGFYYYWKEYGPDATHEGKNRNRDIVSSGVPSAPRIVKINGYGGLRKAGSKKRMEMFPEEM